jgi:creatinine amidohydrolase
MTMDSQRLTHLSWPAYVRIAGAGGTVVLPAGAVEQHGPHLPLLTDALLARTLAQRLCGRLGCHFVEPLLYGTRSDPFSGGGEAFPGTLSLSPESFLALAHQLLTRLAQDGFRRFVLLNAHFENAPLLREAARRLTASRDDCKVLLCSWWDLLPPERLKKISPKELPGMDLEHAAFLETSLMLHLHPDLVGPRESFPDGAVRPPGYELYPEALQRPADHTGSLAPATTASAEAGERLCGLVLDSLERCVREELDICPAAGESGDGNSGDRA